MQTSAAFYFAKAPKNMKAMADSLCFLQSNFLKFFVSSHVKHKQPIKNR